MLDLNEYSKKAFDVAFRRQQNGGKININTIPMLKHCATEVCEAVEAYTDFVDGGSLSIKHFASELADIVSCVLIISASENIDIESALEQAYARNKLRSELKGDKK